MEQTPFGNLMLWSCMAHSMGTLHLSEEASEPKYLNRKTGAMDPLDYTCEPHFDLKLLLWKTTKVRSRRFRPQDQVTLLPTAKRPGYLHFQEKADMWLLFSTNIWAMHLKLSAIFCLQKVTQMFFAQGKQSGLRPEDNLIYLKAAGEN